MNSARLNYLHNRFLTGTLTAAESKEWLHAVNDPEMEDHILSMIENHWNQLPETSLNDMSEHRSNEILMDIINDQKKVIKVTDLWRLILKVAAVLVMILSAGVLFKHHKKTVDQQVRIVQDAPAGKMAATLTLANGKKIKLNDAINGKLAEESGVFITKSGNGELIYEIKGTGAGDGRLNTLSTGKGETYKLRLPDSSIVYLNASSSLTYSATLNRAGKRIVSLVGEGYFEIHKDKQHPFVVKTNNQEVEVLGTQFNLNAYEDEPAVTTTLLEGAVKITADKKVKLLKPGFQAVNAGGVIEIIKADINQITDWKNGDFYFENADFKTVMRKIGRWYNVEIRYTSSVPDNLISNGVISRNNKLSAVLKSIERSGQVHFKIENHTVIISK